MEELLQYPFVRMPDDYFSNLTFYLEIDNIRLTEFKRVLYFSDSFETGSAHCRSQRVIG